jgi:hypothetical protein
MSALPSRSRHAATLVELLGAMALAALLAGLTVPPSLRLVDRIVVRSAIDAIASACALARGAAVMRGVRAVVTIDTALAAVRVTVAGDTLLDRVLDPGGPLTVTASRVEVVYAPTGLGYGASNTTVLARRGSAADTLFTSRLGRVRH